MGHKPLESQRWGFRGGVSTWPFRKKVEAMLWFVTSRFQRIRPENKTMGLETNTLVTFENSRMGRGQAGLKRVDRTW